MEPQLRKAKALEKYDCDELKWRLEVDKLLGALGATSFDMMGQKRSRRGKRSDPFSRLSTTMGKIKTTQAEKEVSLKAQLTKVELDKYILMKEKLEAIWNDKLYRLTGPYDIKQDMSRQKQTRAAFNAVQKEGYMRVLEFVKERKQIPLAEEKPALNGMQRWRRKRGIGTEVEKLASQFCHSSGPCKLQGRCHRSV